PYTLDRAYPIVREATVALGFPDILFEPRDAYRAVLARLSGGGADAVLGLFPGERPAKSDMVEVDAAGRVRLIVIKPRRTRLRWSWAIAAWTPAFSEFLHAWVRGAAPAAGAAPRERHLGDVIQ